MHCTSNNRKKQYSQFFRSCNVSSRNATEVHKLLHNLQRNVLLFSDPPCPRSCNPSLASYQIPFELVGIFHCSFCPGQYDVKTWAVRNTLWPPIRKVIGVVQIRQQSSPLIWGGINIFEMTDILYARQVPGCRNFVHGTVQCEHLGDLCLSTI